MAFSPKTATGHRAILISGDDDSARRDALKQILAHLAVAEDDLDVESFTADSRSPAEWVGAAATIPFLSERRVVVVRNIGRVHPEDIWPKVKLEAKHPFVPEIQSLPPSALLVLVADEEMSEGAQKKVEPATKAWTRLLGHAGGAAFDFRDSSENITDALRKHAQSLGKSLSNAGANTLAELLGGKLAACRAELDKLAIYVGDQPEIRETDIRNTVSPDLEYNVFRLVDTVVAGQSASALSQLKTMIGHTAKVEEEAFPRIFPMLSRQFRLLWQARLCVEANCQPARPTPEVAALLPQKPNISQERDWLHNKLMKTARNLSYPKLSACLSELVRADASIKGARPSASPAETLEQMVLRMAAICR